MCKCKDWLKQACYLFHNLFAIIGLCHYKEQRKLDGIQKNDIREIDTGVGQRMNKVVEGRLWLKHLNEMSRGKGRGKP